MNRKNIAAIFVVALMVCAAVTCLTTDDSSADDTVVCKIGEVEYTSLVDALTAASDNTKTIELLQSTTLTSAKPLNGNMVIKSGVTLTLNAQMNLSSGKNGTLTIEEGAELKFTGSGYRMYHYGTIVNNGTFTLADSTSIIVYQTGVINNNGTIDISKGTFQMNASGILNNAADGVISLLDTGKFTLTGTINNNGTINFGISANTINAAGVLTNNGIITMTTGSIANSGKITNNGTFEFSKAKITGTGTIDGTNPIVVKPYMEIGETTPFVSGTGTVTHAKSSDTGKFADKSTTSMVFTITSLPTSTGDWNDFGTAKLTSITFNDNADLIYIPSYILGKTTLGSETVCTYYKVTEIDGDVKSAINAKTIGIVLPNALKDLTFESGVSKLNGTSFTDGAGNVFDYEIVETSPIWYNGYTTYTSYTGATAGAADARYCEQAKIVKVTPAAGVNVIMFKGSVQWSNSDMFTPDTWVASASASFGDVIGTAVTSIALEEDADVVTPENKLYVNVDNTMDTTENTKELNTIVQKRYTIYLNLGGTIYTTFTGESEMDLGNGSWETVYGVSPEDALIKAVEQRFGAGSITMNAGGWIDEICGISGSGSSLSSEQDEGGYGGDIYLYPVQWIMESDGWVVSDMGIASYSGNSFKYAVTLEPLTFDMEPTSHTFADAGDAAKYEYLMNTFNWAGWGNLPAPHGSIYVDVEGDDSIVFSCGVHAQYVTSADILDEADTVDLTFYKKLGEGDDATYQKIREVTLDMIAGTQYTFRPVTVNVTNEEMTLGVEYTLTTLVYNIDNTQVTTFNGGYTTSDSVTYIVKDDENIRILLKTANVNNYKSIQILTMADTVKNFDVTFDNNADYRIYAPEDANVSVSKYNAGTYSWEPITGGEKEGNKTTFSNFPNANIQLRISGNDYITTSFLMTSANSADFAKQFYIDESILSEISGFREKTLQNRDLTAYYGANTSNIIVSGNFENFLNLDVNDTYTLTANKSISSYQPEANPVGYISQNLRVIEPDFTYAIMNLDGTPSDVLTVDGNVITAAKEGLAVVIVGYNGFSYFSLSSATAMSYAFNAAIWSENLDVIVVKVGDNGTIKTNMMLNEGANFDVLEDGTYKYQTGEMDESAQAGKSSGDFLDSENDVLYYLDGEPGYYYSFTPEAGCTVKVWNPVFSDAGEIAYFTEGTVTENNGTFTVLMTEGRNIIQVNKGDAVAFQVATVKKTTMTVSYTYKTEEGKLYPGDEIIVKFDHVDSPQSRVGIYNTHTYLYYYIGDADGVDFEFTDAPNATIIGQYDFASLEASQTLKIVIPDGISVGDNEIKGAFMIKGFGAPIGTHHNPGITLKTNSSPGIRAVVGQLPSISVEVEDYATIVYDTELEAVTATEFTSDYTLKQQDSNKDLGTIMVSKGDVINYTLKTSGNAIIGYLNTTVPAGWTHDLTQATMSSAKQITFTFTATENMTANIALSFNNTYSFILNVLVMDGTVSTTQYVVKEGSIIDPTAIAGYGAPSDKAFYGWNTKADGTGTMYMVGDDAPAIGYHELYAIFLDTGEGFTYIDGTEFAYKYDAATQTAEFMHVSAPGLPGNAAFGDDIVTMTGKDVANIILCNDMEISTLTVDGDLTIMTAVTLGKTSSIVLSAGSGTITGIVGTSSKAYQTSFDEFAATTNDITIGTSGQHVTAAGNGSEGSMVEQSITVSAEVVSFSKDGKTTVVKIGSYDSGKAAIAGKIVMTYGTYIEASNGVWYDPFNTATVEYDGECDIVYIETDKRVESCTIECEYSFMGKDFVTPSVTAGRTAASAVDIDFDDAIYLNGDDIKKGDILQYGEYIVTVKDGYQLVNPVETVTVGEQTVMKLTYVGQKLIVNETE